MRCYNTGIINGRLFYVIKTYYDSKGIEHSMTVEKLGNENDIRAKYGCDPDEWAKEHVRQLNEKEKEENQEYRALSVLAEESDFIQNPLRPSAGYPRLCRRREECAHAFNTFLEHIFSCYVLT